MTSSVLGQTSMVAQVLSSKALRHHRGIAADNDTCPGTLIGDEYYITDPSKDLSVVPIWLTICSLHYETSSQSSDWNPSMGIVGSYSCISDALELDCYGKIVNPNYVFWDEASKAFDKTPTLCTSEFSSCQEVRESNQCVGNNMYCGGGDYICQLQDDLSWCKGAVQSIVPLTPCPPAMACEDLKESFALIAQEDEAGSAENVVDYCDCEVHGGTFYRCVDDVQVCEGEFLRDWLCPPRVVSSIHEIEHYCSREYHILDEGTAYSCRFHGEEVCAGKIDFNLSFDPETSSVYGTAMKRPMTTEEAIRSWRLEHGLPEETDMPLYKELMEGDGWGGSSGNNNEEEDLLEQGEGALLNDKGQSIGLWSSLTFFMLSAVAIVGLLQFRRRRRRGEGAMSNDLELDEAAAGGDGIMMDGGTGGDFVLPPSDIGASSGEENGYEMTELGTFT